MHPASLILPLVRGPRRTPARRSAAPSLLLGSALLLLATACGPQGAASADATATATDKRSAGPHRQVLAPSASPLPVFSPAVRTGNLVFLSGQIGNKPGTTELVDGGIQGETEQTLTNIKTLLEQIGLSMQDVVKCTVFLADMQDYGAMNEVYRRYFPEAPPARSALAASGLAFGARVEIECIAAAR